MKPYADSNLLVRYYLQGPDCQTARKLLHGAGAREHWPIPATTLVRIEVVNALERMVFESRTLGKLPVTPEIAAAARADFEEDLESAAMIRPSALSLEEIEPLFDSLAARHTAKHGFRTYDILHVASSLHLGCDTFWSFDAKARSLARLEGLKLNAALGTAA